MMMNKRLFATLMPGLFVDPATQEYNPLSNALWNMTAMDMPHMPGMPEHHMPMDHTFEAITPGGAGRRLAHPDEPDDDEQTPFRDGDARHVPSRRPGHPGKRMYNGLSDSIWDMDMSMEEMDKMMLHMMLHMKMNMGECEGGMDMSGMTGMDMGCDTMDHSMTPMMLIQAQGEVKPAEAMGHAGHDMGAMPAEAMPGHDMSAMPAESMPPGL